VSRKGKNYLQGENYPGWGGETDPLGGRVKTGGQNSDSSRPGWKRNGKTERRNSQKCRSAIAKEKGLIGVFHQKEEVFKVEVLGVGG